MQFDQISNLSTDIETTQFAEMHQVVIHINARRATHIVVCGLAGGKGDGPKETISIMEGARVIASDGKYIGKIDRVFAKPAANGPRDYLIAQALLLKEKGLIPVEWIDTFGNDEVRLAVGAGVAMQAL